MKGLVARTLVQKLLIPFSSVAMLLEYDGDYIGGLLKLEDRMPMARNVFETDVFTWFADIARVNPQFRKLFNSKLRVFAERLDNLDMSDVSVDLLRRVYQEFFDRALRRALGEFYTSEEIVDEILDAAGFNGPAVEEWARRALQSDGEFIVDLACGSGTFLLRVIERIKATGLTPREKLRVITNKVIGIDIHPFAIAMARCNYIIAIADLVHSAGLKIERIPIYWADSLAKLAREKQTRIAEDVAPVYVATVPVLGSFRLPDPTMINWEKLLILVRKALDMDWSENSYIENLKDEFGERPVLIYEDLLVELYRSFKERERLKRDGRWITLLKNITVVERIKGKCYIVCSNPPWVRFQNIADELKKTLKRECRFFRERQVGWNPALKRVRVPRITMKQFDYSIAFVDVGLDYLRDGGILAFVITSKVQQALYANLMRKELLKYKIERLIDYSLYPVQLFKDAVNYPLLLIVKKTVTPATDLVRIDVINHSGRRRSWFISKSEISLNENDPESPWMIAPPEVIKCFRKMQRAGKRLGDTVEAVRGAITAANDIYFVKEFTCTTNPDVLLVVTEGGQRVRIEKRMIRPLLRGRDISEWRFEINSWIIWTHDDEGNVLEKLPPEAMKYFEQHKAFLESRREYTISRPINSGAPYWIIGNIDSRKLREKVAWREIATKIEAVVIEAEYNDPRLGVVKIIPDHKVYFLPVGDESVCHALCALLNSTPCRAFVMSFAERLRGANFDHLSWVIGMIPIPRFIASLIISGELPKGRHRELFDKLVKISKELHEAARTGVIDRSRLEELDRLVAEAYELTEEELKTIKDYFDFVYVGSD